MLEDFEEKGGQGLAVWDNRKRISKKFFYLNLEMDQLYADYLKNNALESAADLIMVIKIIFDNLESIAGTDKMEGIESRLEDLKDIIEKIKDPENIPNEFDENLDRIRRDIFNVEQEHGLRMAVSSEPKDLDELI